MKIQEFLQFVQNVLADFDDYLRGRHHVIVLVFDSATDLTHDFPDIGSALGFVVLFFYPQWTLSGCFIVQTFSSGHGWCIFKSGYTRKESTFWLRIILVCIWI